MKIYGNVDVGEGGAITNASIVFGDSFPEGANKGELFYKNNSGLFVYDGTAWISFLNKAGDNMTGSLSFAKDAGVGLKVDNGYGWRDITCEIVPRTSGTNAPDLNTFIGSMREYSFVADDQGDARFHIPHDYVPGTDMHIHMHWGHNGTGISGAFQVDFNASYSKGHSQGVFSSQVANYLTVGNLNITDAPQYTHNTVEIQLSSATGSGQLLNTSLFEPDGIILVHFVATSIPTITGSASVNAPFIFTVDLHYQSSSVSTKNRTPNFYA